MFYRNLSFNSHLLLACVILFPLFGWYSEKHISAIMIYWILVLACSSSHMQLWQKCSSEILFLFSVYICCVFFIFFSALQSGCFHIRWKISRWSEHASPFPDKVFNLFVSYLFGFGSASTNVIENMLFH